MKLVLLLFPVFAFSTIISSSFFETCPTNSDRYYYITLILVSLSLPYL